jgi:hypothetical protein
MRTTLTLDDDVARAAQELARTTGKRLGEVVSELVRRGLRAEAQIAEKNGLPVFRVPADAEIIPADRVRKLLDEEPF